MNRIEYFKKVVQGKKVLDLGCLGDSNNNLSDTLASCCDYKGVEICKARLPGHPKVIYGDIQRLPVLGKFDVILALEVIEHIEDLDGLMKGIRANLAVGGQVFFAFDNPWAINAVWNGWFSENTGYIDKTVCQSDHHFWVCATTLGNLLRKYGFRITYKRYYTESDQHKIAKWLIDMFIPRWHQSILVVAE